MADMDDAIQAMDPLSDEDLHLAAEWGTFLGVRDVENMAGELLRARTTLARLTAEVEAQALTIARLQDESRATIVAVTAERDEARNARDHYMDVWNEQCAQCAHVREACETLGVDPEQVAADSWTLRDYAARVVKERDEARGLLARIGDWTHQFGGALCPTAGSADSFGDGMREAKRRVATIVAAHLGRSE